MSEGMSGGKIAVIVVLGLGVGGMCIVGLLAAIAIPAFQKFVNRSKAAEAHLNLRTISDGAQTYFVAEHYNKNGEVLPAQFPTGSGALQDTASAAVPLNVPRGVKELITVEDKAKNPWKALEFQPLQPVYFQYRYQAKNVFDGIGSRFEVHGVGDLDGDGEVWDMVLSGKVNTLHQVDVSTIETVDLENEFE